jgi:hypothetical protein
MPAKSQAQQKFMGMVHATQKGAKPASPAVAKAAGSMKKKSATDFAATPRKGLPAHVKKEAAIQEGLNKSTAAQQLMRAIPEVKDAHAHHAAIFTNPKKYHAIVSDGLQQAKIVAAISNGLAKGTPVRRMVQKLTDLTMQAIDTYNSELAEFLGDIIEGSYRAQSEAQEPPVKEVKNVKKEAVIAEADTQVFAVHIPANIYDGKYYDHRTVRYYVPTSVATNEKEAIAWVNSHKKEVLAKLDKMRAAGGAKRYVALPIEKNVFFKSTYHVKPTTVGNFKENAVKKEAAGSYISYALTLDQAWRDFKREILPSIKMQYEKNKIPDKPARREAWNDYINMLARSGAISDKDAATWTHPRGLETEERNNMKGPQLAKLREYIRRQVTEVLQERKLREAGNLANFKGKQAKPFGKKKVTERKKN